MNRKLRYCKLLEESELAQQKISFDALHCKTKTLEMITRVGGKYLVRLKENQKELKKQITQVMGNQCCLMKISVIEKGRGRIKRRIYRFNDVLEIKQNDLS